MEVSLVSVTQPEILGDDLDTLSAEELIVYCARVSSPGNQGNTATSDKLIKYLLSHKHFSPFEMADMTVEVTTSRAIAAQILRHWSLSVQEFSLRYAKASMGFEIYEARKQSVKNRQAGDELCDEETSAWWQSTQAEHYELCQRLYDEAISKGIAKELARMLLPLATRTKLYLKGDVRSWIFYLLARLAPDAQKEHRDVAAAIQKIFGENFPSIAAAIFQRDEAEVAPETAIAEAKAAYAAPYSCGDVSAPFPATWSKFTWPEWVPVELREKIEGFYTSDFNRSPADWVKSSGGAPFKESVSGFPLFDSKEHPAITRVEGRYVYRWNDLASLVMPDGSVVNVRATSR